MTAASSKEATRITIQNATNDENSSLISVDEESCNCCENYNQESFLEEEEEYYSALIQDLLLLVPGEEETEKQVKEKLETVLEEEGKEETKEITNERKERREEEEEEVENITKQFSSLQVETEKARNKKDQEQELVNLLGVLKLLEEDSNNNNKASNSKSEAKSSINIEKIFDFDVLNDTEESCNNLLEETNDEEPDLDFSIHSFPLSESSLVEEEVGEEKIMSSFSFKHLQEQMKQTEQTYYGHKETIFDISISPCKTYVATCSQDSTVRIWKISNNKLIHCFLGHDKEYECLRCSFYPEISNEKLYLVSAAANGIVKYWSFDSEAYECLQTLNLQEYSASGTGEEKEDNDTFPQVYALQYILYYYDYFLLTSADDYIHLFSYKQQAPPSSSGSYEKIISFQFLPYSLPNHGVVIYPYGFNHQHAKPSSASSANEEQVYGGKQRNPKNQIFVFDSSYHATFALLATALSDGTIRIINIRGVCVSILQLPDIKIHFTAVEFSTAQLVQDDVSSYLTLASCVATGHVVLWTIRTFTDGSQRIISSCRSIFQGGHDYNRPLFGCSFIANNYLLSYGVDGQVVMWDANSVGDVFQPLATLIEKVNFPLYTLQNFQLQDENTFMIFVAGGSDPGFLGMAFYSYKLTLNFEVDLQQSSGEELLLCQLCNEE